MLTGSPPWLPAALTAVQAEDLVEMGNVDQPGTHRDMKGLMRSFEKHIPRAR